MFRPLLHPFLAAPAALALALNCVGIGATFAAPATPAAKPETYLVQERPVSAEEIKIGICNPASGRQGERGRLFVRGTEAAFGQINAAGGVHGRKLKLVTQDDRYESLYTIVGTQKLINDEKVFALCNFVGTASVSAVMPMLTEAKIPLVGSSTGAGSLRTNTNPYIFNVRPSYAEEIEAIVEHLVKDRGVKKIAVLYQQDGFGDSIVQGVDRALRQRNLALLGKAGYVRNSVDLDAAVDQLVAMKPEAVIVGAVPQPGAAFARVAQTRKFNAIFCALSPISAEEFVTAAGPAAEGVLVTQVFPSPNDVGNPLVAEYQTAMRAVGDTSFSYASLEGYLNARVLVEGLRGAGDTPTPESFVAAMEKLQFTVGDQVCAFSPGNHQGLHQVYFTKIDGGQARPITASAPATVAKK
jgi:ABC-type branched-subunit amino acid transport system substrate-binding protein